MYYTCAVEVTLGVFPIRLLLEGDSLIVSRIVFSEASLVKAVVCYPLTKYLVEKETGKGYYDRVDRAISRWHIARMCAHHVHACM